MLERSNEKDQDKDLVIRRIHFWIILVILGIVGSVLSLLMIPINSITIVAGITIWFFGIHLVHKLYYGSNSKDENQDIQTVRSKAEVRFLSNHNFGLALIFSGFVLAWVFIWFVLLCYFRFSNYLFAIYL